MENEFIQKLRYSYSENNDNYTFPSILKDSFQIINNFFKFNVSNKLCLVFPSKEYSAQWISTPLVLSLLEHDFSFYNNARTESYKQYNLGDFLLLNNIATVEWHGYNNKGICIKAAEEPPNGPAFFTLPFSVVEMLQPASIKNTKLSKSSKIIPYLRQRSIHPIDNLLNICTSGNFSFQKNSICLVSKIVSYEKSIEELRLSNYFIRDYFEDTKLDDNGNRISKSPLIISKNLSNLFLYLFEFNNISKIIIDGFSNIIERATDFSGIDEKNIPTILVTDLSEIDNFENIGNYGFEFFNFTKENIANDFRNKLSPFNSLETKLRNYSSFNVVKEICEDSEIESLTQKIQSIEKDESNNDLTTLIISLFQIKNLLSRIIHIPTSVEIENFKLKINNIEALFLRSKMWLGNSQELIKESIFILKSIIDKFASKPSEKCVKLKKLINSNIYDYIICATEDEAKSINNFLNSITALQRPLVIPVSDINNGLLLRKGLKAILTGWTKSKIMNRVFSSFIFSELTLLFYQFENKYCNSLQKRNKRFNENIKPTIDIKGTQLRDTRIISSGFTNLYSSDEDAETPIENSFNIIQFEMKLENAQYSKYAAKGNFIESVKAKRIDFENNFFIYASESHKFLVINDLIDGKTEKAKIHRRKLDFLKLGDIIAFINTDKDMLIEIVEKKTDGLELASVKQWTELWKNQLKEYFVSIDKDFKKLVSDLRKCDCKKHETTIKTWLQDESRIGPEDDSDLINIAVLTNSDLLLENIPKVRAAIKKMKGWRMQASDFIIDKIKSQILNLANSSLINKKISVEGLGTINVLKITDISEERNNIDVRFVNKLLEKEFI